MPPKKTNIRNPNPNPNKYQASDNKGASFFAPFWKLGWEGKKGVGKGAYQSLAAQAIRALDVLAQSFQIFCPLGREVVWRLVDQNPLHIEARVFRRRGPACICVYLFEDFGERLAAIVDADVAHCNHIGLRVQLRHLAHVVVAW